MPPLISHRTLLEPRSLGDALKLLRDLREMRPFMANLFRFLGRRFPGERFDIFEESPTDRLHLFLLMKDIRNELHRDPGGSPERA